MTIAHFSFRPSADRDGIVAWTTGEQLARGGGERIVIDQATGLNRYGCPPLPQRGVLAFGSCTASTISAGGFAVAQQFWHRIRQSGEAEDPVAYAREAARIRGQIARGFELPRGTEVILTASGTDAHLIGAQLWAGESRQGPVEVILLGEGETGRGVPAALAGRHFDGLTPGGIRVKRHEIIRDAVAMRVRPVALRLANGRPRAVAEVDEQVCRLVNAARARGRRVLVVATDVSKTGLLAPSRPCIEAISRIEAGRGEAMGGGVSMLVDACQMRMSTMTLRSYLEAGCMVAVTGSKFLGGPSFCGAVLVPRMVARRLSRIRSLPEGLKDYMSQPFWPDRWPLRQRLADRPNWGLLLRWEVALCELAAFRTVSQEGVLRVVRAFGAAMGDRFANDGDLVTLPQEDGDAYGTDDATKWDHWPTIFSFGLRRAGRNGEAVDLAGLEWVYQRLRQAEAGVVRCELGQPVCGAMAGELPRGVLRLCLSAGLIVDAARSAEHLASVVGRAHEAMDRAIAMGRAVG